MMDEHGSVAQWTERRVPNPTGGGSTPSRPIIRAAQPRSEDRPDQPHPSDVDAPHRWELSSAEERYEWWNTDWGTGSDW